MSQEKYKKRKAKKHIATVTVRRPTARLLCEAYFEKVCLFTNLVVGLR
jgi:tRNA (adenine-N(1)-)-methyltransferase non-catalytic subunit